MLKSYIAFDLETTGLSPQAVSYTHLDVYKRQAEICLLATKGHPKRQAANIHQFIISPIEAHSKKPDEARAKIISLMGDLPRDVYKRQPVNCPMNSSLPLCAPM